MRWTAARSEQPQAKFNGKHAHSKNLALCLPFASSVTVRTASSHPNNLFANKAFADRLCGLVVRVLGYRSGGTVSIPGTNRKKKFSGSGTGSTQPREYN
jgi:hypothetical protein